MKLLAPFIGRKHRGELRALEAQLSEMVDTVDQFGKVLGPRNWVFHDRLPLAEVRELVSLPVDEAEDAFIRLHTETDRLDWWVRQLAAIEGLRERRALLECALKDYKEKRYHATVLTLLVVIDGFVNDVNKGARKGLHARDPEEMKTWDRVVGHHMGLTHVIPVFQKSFKNARTSDEPIFELHRNGILHGNLTNFNNVVVATKAWNYLAAVTDWADDLKKQKIPDEPAPSWRGLREKLHKNEENRRALDSWTPSILTSGMDGWESDPLKAVIEGFFSDWQAQRYGRLVATLPATAYSTSKTPPAGHMRKEFQDYKLEGFELSSLELETPVIAMASASLTVNGRTYQSRSRWIFESRDGALALPGSGRGRWVRVFLGPDAFTNDDGEAT